MALLPLSLLLLCTAAFSRHHSAPEDPYAFPKYRVAFLNGLPLLNDTAQQWLREGLFGGEREFMEQPWDDESAALMSYSQKSISGADETQATFTGAQDEGVSQPPPQSEYRLEEMKMGPEKSYLCLIPPPQEELPPPEVDEPDPDPFHSWSLLNPLSGNCIYHRQGWFTYSYCHNDHVRQFREVVQTQPGTPPGQAEEDPMWEAFTLGRSPSLPEPGTELTTAQQAAVQKSIELGRGGASHYLVQRWSDGTFCDKTGGRRQIEVQFHCSMITTDSILFIKETKTCQYVMVIHTPRLCGEPGFKTRLEQGQEAVIRCRQVIASPADAIVDRHAGEARHPYARRARAPKLPAAVAPPKDKDAEGGDKKGGAKGFLFDSAFIGTALTKLFGDQEVHNADEVRQVLGFGDPAAADAEGGGVEHDGSGGITFLWSDGENADEWIELTDEEIQELIRTASTGEGDGGAMPIELVFMDGNGDVLEDPPSKKKKPQERDEL